MVGDLVVEVGGALDGGGEETEKRLSVCGPGRERKKKRTCAYSYVQEFCGAPHADAPQN